jgi:hypothetical protein
MAWWKNHLNLLFLFYNYNLQEDRNSKWETVEIAILILTIKLNRIISLIMVLDASEK